MILNIRRMNAVLLQFSVERGFADTQQLRSQKFVTIQLAQGFENSFFFLLGEGHDRSLVGTSHGGRSGGRVLASMLASHRWEWLVALMLAVSYQFERRAIPYDMLATIDAEVGFDITSQLHRIRAPTLLLAGARDRAFSLDLMRATAAGISGSRLIVYPRAGHVGTMANPHFGSDVAGFLAEHMPPSAP